MLLVVLSVLAFWGLDHRWGVVPPLGKFLNPATGFWQNGRAADDLPVELDLPGLEQFVTVVWDDRQIPHIFAQNSHDLYMAQGYLVARARLWQLDLTPRAAAGRLSEILGPGMIEYDRLRRRIGMGAAAEASVALMENDPVTGPVIAAFAAGVNACIDQLEHRDLPVEFKLLDYRPERFTPLSVALLLQSFQYTLAFRSSDAPLTRSLAAMDPDVVQQLYPLYPHDPEPVIPAGTPWEFVPQAVRSLGLPGPSQGPNKTDEADLSPEATLPAEASPLGEADLPPEASPPAEDDEPPAGSNNWALAGSRTATGRAILATDIHLPLSLPSIWYEMQLTAPGMSIYGITPPGAPGIIYGFNDALAWGITNGHTDVVDWYRVEFRDDSHERYRYDRGWSPTTKRVEAIHVYGGETIYDTVVYTHHGPVPFLPGEESSDPMLPVGCALRWTALDPSNELRAILDMNAAGNCSEFVSALDPFHCPPLNFAIADTSGEIAIVHAGHLPLRWPTQGRTILDGSDPAHEWQGWIPGAHVPQVTNPARGFVSSNNQHATDETYPYWLGSEYQNVDRARRVNELLHETVAVTPRDMLLMQTDVLNVHARQVLPVMLGLLEDDSLTTSERQSADELVGWNYEHGPDIIATRIFTFWWWSLNDRLWSDDIQRPDGDLAWPGRDVMIWLLLHAPDHPMWDDRRSPDVVESRRDIVRAAFHEAHRELTEAFGPYGPQWAVGRSRGTRIPHLGRIPGFGSEHLETGGTSTTINATRRSYGPTWRMVVSLESPVRAWGILAGGQSGHPGSGFYRTDLEEWVEGLYREFLIFPSPDTDHERVAGRTTLQGGS